MLTSAQAMSDLDIANAYQPLPIQEIAKRLGLSPDELHPYGRHKGKISLSALDRLKHKPRGRYILVTAINPTPLGEGKTTTSIGLAMGLFNGLLSHRWIERHRPKE